MAFAEAFRRWGIFPDGVRGMAESELRYPHLDDARASNRCVLYDQDLTKNIFEGLSLDWGLDSDRHKVWKTMDKNAMKIHGWLTSPEMVSQLPAFGLTVAPTEKKSVYTKAGCRRSRCTRSGSCPARRVPRSARHGPRRRSAPAARGYDDPAVQKMVDEGSIDTEAKKRDFRFRRGCTLIIDPLNQKVRYAISTRKDVSDDDELERVRAS